MGASSSSSFFVVGIIVVVVAIGDDDQEYSSFCGAGEGVERPKGVRWRLGD